MYYYILLYGRSLVFHTIFCFVFCFAIDFIVIVLMLRSLMPAVIFAFVIAFIKFICIFMYFFALHIFFRAAVCVYKFVYWKSVFVRLCLFLHVYLLVCQREVVGKPANQWVPPTDEPAGSWGMPCEGRPSWQAIVGPITDLDHPARRTRSFMTPEVNQWVNRTVFRSPNKGLIWLWTEGNWATINQWKNFFVCVLPREHILYQSLG